MADVTATIRVTIEPADGSASEDAQAVVRVPWDVRPLSLEQVHILAEEARHAIGVQLRRWAR